MNRRNFLLTLGATMVHTTGWTAPPCAPSSFSIDGGNAVTTPCGGGVVDGELFSTNFASGTAESLFTEVWGSKRPTVVTDPTALSGRSLRYDWDSGFENFNAVRPTVSGTNRRKLHVRIHLKQDAGANNGGIQKIMRFRLSSGVTVGTINFQWGRILFNGDGYGDGNNHVQTNAAAHGPDTFRNQWRYLEVMLDYSNLSTQHIAAWVDGTSVLDDRISLGTPMSSTINLNSVVILGTFNSPADDRFDHIDKVDISANFMGVP